MLQSADVKSSELSTRKIAGSALPAAPRTPTWICRWLSAMSAKMRLFALPW